MSPQCTFNTGGFWQRQPRLFVLFRLVLQDLFHSQPSDWLSLTEKHSILRFLIQKFLNRAQVYFMLPTAESIPVMAGNYCVSAPRGRKSRMRNSWDCPFNTPLNKYPCQYEHTSKNLSYGPEVTTFVFRHISFLHSQFPYASGRKVRSDALLFSDSWISYLTNSYLKMFLRCSLWSFTIE